MSTTANPASSPAPSSGSSSGLMGAAQLRELNADLRAFAVEAGVCVRPVLQKVTDRLSGEVTSVAIRCKSTRASQCPSCAARARTIRMQQCAEGWHLDVDPLADLPRAIDDLGLLGEGAQDESDMPGGVDELDADLEDLEDLERVVRSTQRRQDVPDLPRRPCEQRTVGQVFTSPGGTRYRPSMFVTLTLPSYGKVQDGVPVNPDTYDYWRAGRDAIAFAALFDRWMQNLRRCAGFKVQYFGVIEAQRRRAAHVHLAIRGAIPRQVLRQVTAATYVSQWWPPHGAEDVQYTTRTGMPVWSTEQETYVDPFTGKPLTSWKAAVTALAQDPDAKPSHVARFGRQVDIKGIIAPSPDADRAVAYLTKYLTKSIADTYLPEPETGAAQMPARAPGWQAETPAMSAHIDRLHAVVRLLPCGPRCANWLRYGIAPQDAGPGLAAGRCPSAAHERENLGLGGRRVLASRHWSGKTLKEHIADRATVVRETLQAAGISAPQADRLAAEHLLSDGQPRFVWEHVQPRDRDYPAAITGAITERIRWRQQYDAAKAALTQPPGNAPPDCGQPFSNSPAA